jgi:hypothetical protein
LSPAADVRRLTRFARYWDLIGNSGRFQATLPLVLGASPFARFLELSDWLQRTACRTHAIPMERLYELVHGWLLEQGIAAATAALQTDYQRSGARNKLVLGDVTVRSAPAKRRRLAVRQARHLAP